MADNYYRADVPHSMVGLDPLRGQITHNVNMPPHKPVTQVSQGLQVEPSQRITKHAQHPHTHQQAPKPAPAPQVIERPQLFRPLKDPQYVSEYVYDIMDHLYATEKHKLANPRYMERQVDLTPRMREILIDWLIEVHLKFNLHQDTLFLTVSILDRFLECRAVDRSKLQLVGCSAMLLASKYEEIYSPEIDDFVFVADNAYSKHQIVAMERIILQVLGFNFTTPYATRFADYFLQSLKASDIVKSLTYYSIERTLQEYEFIRYPPSLIAASALSFALYVNGEQPWNESIGQLTRYPESEVQSCFVKLWQLMARPCKYRSVRKKFSHTSYHQVARFEFPAPPIAENPAPRGDTATAKPTAP